MTAPATTALPQMTLRQWYAGQALAGLLAGQFRDSGNYNFDGVPREAFNIADAMIAALKETGDE